MPIIKENPDSYTQVKLNTPNQLEMYISRFSGVLLYVDYTKGDETELILSFLVQDKEDPTLKYYQLTERNFSSREAVPFIIKLTGSGLFHIPIPVGGSSDRLRINAEFLNSVAVEGTMNVYARIEAPYSS